MYLFLNPCGGAIFSGSIQCCSSFYSESATTPLARPERAIHADYPLRNRRDRSITSAYPAHMWLHPTNEWCDAALDHGDASISVSPLLVGVTHLHQPKALPSLRLCRSLNLERCSSDPIADRPKQEHTHMKENDLCLWVLRTLARWRVGGLRGWLRGM